LRPYVSSLAAGWLASEPERLSKSLDGTLLFADVSGFTNLSERLARRGRIGAEELTSVLDRVFGAMIDGAAARGGTLLKFGGDALLLLFQGDDHALQACAAAIEMRSELREATKTATSVGRISLRMSTGIHSGPLDFFLVGKDHRELIVTGPAATATVAMESTASAGEIVVSDATKRLLPVDFTGAAKGTGWVLRKRRINIERPDLAPDADTSAEDLLDLVPRALRAHLESGILDSEHRLASIGFLEFGGTDSIVAQSGHRGMAGILQELIDDAQELSNTEDVTFLASDIDADGGKLIFATGVPYSRHDDEGRLVRTLLALVSRQSALTLKAGTNSGHIFAGDVGSASRRVFTVMGDTVNLAARLMAAAPAGSLLASPRVLDRSATLFRTELLPDFHVKGKTDKVRAFSVQEELGAKPPELQEDLPFHGREPEVEMIVGIVDTCSRVGRGGIMTISGQVGIGKSRLIDEVLARCAGVDILMIQAEPSGVDNPYWAFRDPLRQWLGIERGTPSEMAESLIRAIQRKAPSLEWAAPLLGAVMHIEVPDNERTADIEPEFRPERSADVLIELLSSGYSRPVAIVAEDGQWLDEPSLRLLGRIGEAAAERPWTIFLTARPEADFQPLGEEIVLAPLTDEAIRDIAIEATSATPLRPHEVDALVARADGNPLFLGEILRLISDTGSAAELPESLDAVVSTEIDTLAPLPRQLLRYSSVLGRRFRRVTLRDFLAEERIELDDVTIAELGRFLETEDDGRLVFRHSVVHEIAYASLPYSQRRQLHARAGNVIKRQAGRDPDAVAEYLAHHYTEAKEWPGALEYSLKAGAKADALYANVQAASFYERALTAAKQLETSTSGEIASLHEARGDAFDRAGLFEESMAEYGAALKNSPDVVRKADLMLKRARLKAYSGNYPAGLAELSRAVRPIAHTAATDADAARARNYSFRSVILVMQGRAEEALRLAETARAEADRAREKEALARSYMVLDAAYEALARPRPADYLSLALALYESLSDLRGVALVYNNMGATAGFKGELEEAITLYRKAEETNRRIGNEPGAALARANTGEMLIAQGAFDEARSVLADAARVLRAHESHDAAFADIQLARVDLATGDLDGAVAAFRRALEESESMGQSEWALVAKIYLASAHRTRGEGAKAMELLDEAEAVMEREGDVYSPLLALVRAETLRDLGRFGDALDTAVAGREDADDLALHREFTLLDDLVGDLSRAAVAP
jgi:class 3 adenylate cyclase/tetratricopeptide (TPR) repeat protein